MLGIFSALDVKGPRSRRIRCNSLIPQCRLPNSIPLGVDLLWGMYSCQSLCKCLILVGHKHDPPIRFIDFYWVKGILLVVEQDQTRKWHFINFSTFLFTEQIVLSVQQKLFTKLSRENIHGHRAFVLLRSSQQNVHEFHFRRAPTHIQHKYQSLLWPHKSISSFSHHSHHQPHPGSTFVS